MARKTTVFTATHGRDAGKKFKITEMSAFDAEDWAMRALCGVVKSLDGKMPDIDDLKSQGMAGLAVIAAQHLGMLDISLARELKNELTDCLQYRGETESGQEMLRAVQSGDIEEVATLLQLRKETILLHIDFFTADNAPQTN